MRPAAQTQGERGVRIHVGAAPADAARGHKPELWAVVVGISRYQFGDQEIEGSRIANLKYAAEDAQAMSNFLQSEEGGGFREDGAQGRLILLRDEQATKANVTRALDELRKAKPDAYFVIYLAAHGVLVPQRNTQTNQTEEIPYFFLYDTDPRQIEQTALRMSYVQQLIRATPARSGLLLSDTCHSASVDMAGRGVRIAASNRNTGPALAALDPAAAGIGLIAAAGQTESSLERDSLGHGVFTWCLLEGLRGHADTDKDGVVIFDELTRYLRLNVPRMTENRQNPYFNTTAIGANRIALAKVSYAGPPCEPASCGTLVVRAPDLNEVLVAVNDQPPLAVGARIERTWKLPAGEHKLTFIRGKLRDERRATVEAGRSLFYEINLSFTQGDQQRTFKDDARDVVLASSNAPAPMQVNVHVREEMTPQAAARELFDKGIASYDQQKFEEAVDLLTRAIAANNGAYADAFVFRGRAEQSLGRKQDAIASFRAAVGLRPTDYETRTLLAEARFTAGDNLNEVERDLRQIIARHPNDDFARLVLADLLLLRGQVIEAEMQLRRAIRNRPLSPPAHMILADVLMTLGGREAEAARRRGQAMQSNTKLTEAINEAQQAVTLFTELTRRRELTNPAQPTMARVFLSGARYTTTAALAEANHTLARALLQAVEYDDTQAGNQTYLTRARQALDEAARHAAQLREPLRRVLVTETSARLWLLQENVAQAISDAETALRLAAQVPGLTDFYDPHYTLYAAYATQQDFAHACDQLQLYLKGYGFKMQAEQRAALEDELKACRRKAELQLKGKGFDKPAKKKKN